jgi:hypothetical protein
MIETLRIRSKKDDERRKITQLSRNTVKKLRDP